MSKVSLDMTDNISALFHSVKQFAVLTSSPSSNKFANMKYGQRLKTARGKLTQAKLSEGSGVSQSLISQLENSETATGSEYTVRLARALSVSADWLADEIGDMRPEEGAFRPPQGTTQQELSPYAAKVMRLNTDDPLLKELLEEAGRLSDAGVHRLIGEAKGLHDRFAKAKANPGGSSQ